jgi:hypothetical protein
MKNLLTILLIITCLFGYGQSDGKYIRLYINKPNVWNGSSTIIIFSDSCTDGLDQCCDASTIFGLQCDDCITTNIGDQPYVFNCFPNLTEDKIIPLNINIAPDTGTFVIGQDFILGEIPQYRLLDTQYPGYHQMPYICQGPVSNGRFSIFFEYPLNVDVVGGCEQGYVVINNDQSSAPYELTPYNDPNTYYELPPNTDTIFNLPNGDYLLTLNDTIFEQVQFGVSNTIFEDELVVPYTLLTIQDPYIIPYLVPAQSYDEISWDFGDGTPILYNDVNPVHGYTETGIFILKITIIRNGCSKTIQEVITIYNPLSIQPIYPIIPNDKHTQYYYGIDGKLIRK